MFNAVANEVRSNAAAVVSIDSAAAAARVGTAKASLKKESIATLCIRRNILKSIPPDFDKDFLDLLANWKSCVLHGRSSLAKTSKKLTKAYTKFLMKMWLLTETQY